MGNVVVVVRVRQQLLPRRNFPAFVRSPLAATTMATTAAITMLLLSKWCGVALLACFECFYDGTHTTTYSMHLFFTLISLHNRCCHRH